MFKRSSMFKTCYALFITLLLGGCALAQNQSLPYDAWELNFLGRPYMEIWIETADVVDINERVFRGAGSGGVSTGYPRAFSKGMPTKFHGKPGGWPERPTGSGRRITGADLPRLIYVRWQSLAEPQTYGSYIEVPESARELMRKSEDVFCAFDGKVITEYRKQLVVGLAPGGIAKVWVKGPCLPAIEVAHVQGTINPEGPYGGTSNGKHRPLSEESKAYIDKFGIPYGSW
ncbi:DUF2931 family protein [Pseudomonas sp. MDT1-85]